MSKRYKGGRRQILQLEDKKPSRSENEPSSTAPVQKAAAPVPLDSQVADFFKEIDALGINEETAESNTRARTKDYIPFISDNVEESSELETITRPEEKPERSVQQSLPKGNSCSWQEICDETSGYCYYWNVETNEVTWECPVEYVEYLNNAGSSNIKNLSSAGVTKSFKATKKKKKSNDHSVGSIIPITYFGGSSSDESSDESCKEEPSSTYKKSALKSRLPPGNLKEEMNALSSSGEVIGPQLPPNFQFPNNLKNGSNSYDDSLQNEVDEYLEIGLKLSSYSKSSCTNRVENSDSVVTASTSISQPCVNGASFVSSARDGHCESLISDHGKSNDDSNEIGKESPDSTVKKGDNVLDPSVTEESKAVFAYGCRPVVEYDSFTDDDDDQDSPNISSSKDCTFNDSKKNLLKNDELYSKDKICGTNNKLTTGKKESLNLKRNHSGIFAAYSGSKRTKLHDQVDIESLFSMNASHGKFGFGFNREQQLDLENNSFGSSKQQVSASSAVISFVKSNDVFNLNTINEDPPSYEVKESESPNCFSLSDSQVEKNLKNEVAIDSRIDFNAIKGNEVSFSKKSNVSETSLISESKLCNTQNSTAAQNITLETYDSKKVKTENELVEKLPLTNKMVTNDSCITSSKESSSTENSSFLKQPISSKMAATLSEFEKEIDEIGKALGMKSEANVEGTAFGTLQMPVVKDVAKLIAIKRENDLDNSVKVDAPSKSETSATSESSSENITDTIADLSSLLLEKLTLLSSGQTTMNILSVFLIQIQTRLMDWQLGVLESKHFLDRLQEVNQYLLQYEISCVSGDWICQWDRSSKRYFYTNRRKQSSQWSYPTELISQKVPPWACNISSATAASSSATAASSSATAASSSATAASSSATAASSSATAATSSANAPSSSATAASTSASSSATAASSSATAASSSATAASSSATAASSSKTISVEKDDQPVSSSVPENQLQNCSSTTVTDKAVSKEGEQKWFVQPSPPPRPPGVDSPSPPPPPFGPPDSPPPPPPDSTEEKFSIPQDMELENSNDSNPSFITIQHADMSQVQVMYGNSESHSFNQLLDASVHLGVSNAVSSTSVSASNEGCNISRPQIPATFYNTVDTVNVHLGQFQPSCSNNFSVNTSYTTEHTQFSNELSFESKDSEIVACSSTSSVPSTITKTVTCHSTKSEKKKSLLSSDLALKKKNIPSLVQKWEMIKKEQENEENL